LLVQNVIGRIGTGYSAWTILNARMLLLMHGLKFTTTIAMLMVQMSSDN
jgi:hypothetical protein